MADKQLRTVRRTVAVIIHTDVAVSNRALMWEASAVTSDRRVHRVERLTAGAGVNTEDSYAGELYLIDMELTCRGASRHDLTKFVRQYLPECEFHYITE